MRKLQASAPDPAAELVLKAAGFKPCAACPLHGRQGPAKQHYRMAGRGRRSSTIAWQAGAGEAALSHGWQEPAKQLYRMAGRGRRSSTIAWQAGAGEAALSHGRQGPAKQLYRMAGRSRRSSSIAWQAGRCQRSRSFCVAGRGYCYGSIHRPAGWLCDMRAKLNVWPPTATEPAIIMGFELFSRSDNCRNFTCSQFA